MKKLTIILGLIIILLISGCAKKEIIDSKEDLDKEKNKMEYGTIGKEKIE
tara:strand:+ start:1808 stop:1957 length:150 start_codon:yes stop_codon:yes gene_type:complete